MSAKLGREVRLIRTGSTSTVDSSHTEGEAVLLGERALQRWRKKDNEVLAKKYAALCAMFVMDAFGTASRTGIDPRRR